MCINKKRFYNKWLHSWQWIDCGKCPACQQAKANRRTRRINHAIYPGYVTLFVTLTYRNMNIPYIRKDEIHENSAKINIYRDCTVRRVRLTSDYKMAYKYNREKTVVSQIDCFKYRIFPNPKNVRSLPKLRGQSDSNKVGVLFYKDVQDFEKRLRINLLRHYHITKPVYTFKCAELGPSTQRPHFHLLIHVPQEYLVECQSAIIEAWPYDSRIKSAQSIQIARNAASYVSSYVNRGSDFPVFMDCKPLRPKHSFSKHYGLSSSAFSLEEILKAFYRGDLRFSPKDYGHSCKPDLVVYPKYACNYYFAKCYGFSRMSYGEILDLCRNPEDFFKFSDITARMYLSVTPNEFTGNYDYDFGKISNTISLIKRLRSRFCRDFVYIADDGQRVKGLPENIYSYELFADYYYRFWRMYHSNVIRHQYDDIFVQDIPYLFENWDEVYQKHLRSDVLSLVDYDRRSILENPNLFQKNINDSLSLMLMFSKRYKRRKITNRVMAINKFNV